MCTFVEKISLYIKKHNLLSGGEQVLVGVSGGADSVGLLLVLLELAERLDLGLTVAHLNHGIRGEQAQADAEFVANLARKYSLPLCSGCVDVPSLAARTKASLETAGRSARYDFFTRTAREQGCSVVALGHHTDDQIETVLHRIVRGTGLAGLAGIRPRRLLCREPEIHIIRPLLSCRRSELEQYLHDKSITWRTDQTNRRTDVTRNWIRHELLPKLRERLNPQVGQALGRLAEVAGQVEDYLTLEAAALFEKTSRRFGSLVCIDLGNLSKAHPALQNQLLRLSWTMLELPQRNMSSSIIEELLARGHEHLDGGRADRLALPDGAAATYQFGKLLLWAEGQSPASFEPVELSLPGAALISQPALTVQAEVLEEGTDFAGHLRPHDRNSEVLDRGSIEGRLLLRPPVEGEGFRPLGRSSEQPIQEFLLSCRIPKLLHPLTAVVADERGPLWVVGQRLAHRARLGDKTRQAIELSVRFEGKSSRDMDQGA